MILLTVEMASLTVLSRYCCTTSMRQLGRSSTLLKPQLIKPLTCSMLQKRGFLAKEVEFRRDWMAFLQQDVDLRPIAILRWKQRLDWKKLVESHR